jgi:hypothetical protein
MDAFNGLKLGLIAGKGAAAIIDNTAGQYDVKINCSL